MHFLEYTTTTGKFYSLRPEQIRALESEGDQTRIWASIAGVPIVFKTTKPYADVRAELERLAAESEAAA